MFKWEIIAKMQERIKDHMHGSGDDGCSRKNRWCVED